MTTDRGDVMDEVTVLRASIAQERRYLVDRAAKRTPVRLVHAFYDVRGPLSVPALEAAFQCVVDRHDALRTSFAYADGTVEQRIHPAATVRVDEVDMPAGGADAVIRNHLETPLDRSGVPPLRVTVAHVAADQHLLALSIEHMVADGWSLSVLAEEVAECYRAALAGTEPALPPVRVQFPQWATAQRERLSGPRLDRLLERWAERLGPSYDVVEMRLPGATGNPPTYEGRRLDTVLPREVLDGLRALATQERTTLYTVVLAAVYTYLARATGRDDPIVYGSFANRTRADVNRTVGWLSHGILLRARIDAAAPVRETVRTTRSAVLGSMADAEVSLDVLRERLWPDAYLEVTSRPVVFFELIQQWGADFPLAGAEVRQLDVFEGGAMAGVEIRMGERPDGLLVDVVYETSTYTAQTAQRVLDDVCRMLRDFAAVGSSDNG